MPVSRNTARKPSQTKSVAKSKVPTEAEIARRQSRLLQSAEQLTRMLPRLDRYAKHAHTGEDAEWTLRAIFAQLRELNLLKP